jgi:D-3-phosphoglycerate dehydrogenase
MSRKTSKFGRVNFIIDFDSTFIQVEALDELAAIALSENPHRKKNIEKISEITRLGMEGAIPFDESLRRRIALFSANKDHIQELIRVLKKKISKSVRKNKSFFKKHRGRVFILSGGFREIVIPVARSFSISEKNVIANEFLYDKRGNITGFDKKNNLSKEGGKIKAVRNLKLKGKTYVLGDGFTDYQLKEAGLADKFFAFTENVFREKVAQKADHVVSNFDEFLSLTADNQ